MSQHATTDGRTDSEPAFAATVEAGRLAAAVDAVAALVEECVVRAGPDGLAVDAQDPATVALVSLALPADAFEAYEADGVRMGVDLDRLADVVSVADRGEAVRLALDPERRLLHVRAGDLAYTLGLVDPDAVRSPPESVDFADTFDATVGLGGSDVTHLVRAADMVADHLELGVADGTFHAAAEGDVDAVRVEHPADDCGTFEVEGAPVDSLFSTSYLDSVARVAPADADVRVRFGDGGPVEFAFDLAGGSVGYVVAPRIRRD